MSANINMQMAPMNTQKVSMVPMEGFMQQQSMWDADAMTKMRLNKLISLFQYARMMKAVHYPRWKKSFENYMGWDAEIKNKAKYQSRVFVPRPFLVIETKTPRLVKAIVEKDPIWGVMPQSSDDVIKAKMASELLSVQARNHDDLILEFTTYFKDSFIYGGAIGKTGWQFQQDLKQWRDVGPPMIDFVTGTVMPQEVVRSEMVASIDRPYFKNIDIGQVYPDPHASTISQCNYIVEQTLVPYVQLKMLEQMGVYQNCDKIPRTNAIPQIADDFANRRFSVKNATSPAASSSSSPIYDLVEVLEVWWTEDNGQKMKTVIANQSVILQDVPLPYWHNRWPYRLLKDIPMTNEFWGMGDLDSIADLIKEKNDLRNDMNDNRRQFLKAFWAADRNGNIDLDALENMPPGGILETTGKPSDVLEVIRPPQLDTMTFGAEQQIDNDIQMTTGVNDIAIGQPTRSQVRSATGATLMDQSTDSRFGLNALMYLEQVRGIGNDWLALNQQFLSKPVMVRLFGGAYMMSGGGMDMQVTPYDIPQNWDMYVTMGAELQGNKDLQKQQKMQLFQMLMQFPWFNAPAFVVEMMQEFGEKDPQRFIMGMQPTPGNQTQMIMQQLGIDDRSVMSSYAEQMGGMRGGGMQQNPRQQMGGMQAVGMPDMLQGSANAMGQMNQNMGGGMRRAA